MTTPNTDQPTHDVALDLWREGMAKLRRAQAVSSYARNIDDYTEIAALMAAAQATVALAGPDRRIR